MHNSLVEIYDKKIRGNLYAVGDLHGCYDLLMQNLKEIDFDFERDLLISVGDLVDRGAQSLECVALLDQPWFKAIRGNHEQFCIEGLNDASIANYHVRSDIGGEWFYHLDEQIKQKIVGQFLKLPLVLEVQHRGKKYGFVHADIKLNDWEMLKEAIYNEEDSVVQNCIWGRGRIKATNADPTYQVIDGIDEVYLGHTPLKDSTKRQNCFFIDTGAVYSGKLTIVKLN